MGDDASAASFSTKPSHVGSATLNCLACGGSKHRLRFVVNGCPIWQCQTCGLGRAQVEGFDPNSYYTTGYFEGQHSDGYADYLSAEAVLRREFRRTLDFVRRFTSSGRLLDIGCAYGFFLQEARRYFDASGIELAEDAAAHCRDAGLDVICGDADEKVIASFGTLDVVTMLDVIEHLPRPEAAVAAAARQLRPGGLLILTTGDFGAFTARLMGQRWRLMTPPQHLWFFTRQSIKALAEAAGLEMIALTYPLKLVPLSLIMFQLRRMLAMKPSRGTGPSGIGLPVNILDAMRVVFRKRPA